jgi:hypothetical protein
MQRRMHNASTIPSAQTRHRKVSRDMFARCVVVVESEKLSDVVDRAVHIEGKSEWNATAQ